MTYNVCINNNRNNTKINSVINRTNRSPEDMYQYLFDDNKILQWFLQSMMLH